MQADPKSLSELRERRFPGLPVNCGNSANPGLADVAEWRDWTSQPTTPDQLRIEDYLDAFDLGGKRILHVGVGNSGLARRFAARAMDIVGTSVVQSEVEQAAALAIPNYRAVVHNKHMGADTAIGGRFDFIVDNNPTTFCCCLTHLEAMLEFYASSLAPGGQIVTDRVGLGWTTGAPGSNSRWGFTFDDLAAVAQLAGLAAYRVSDFIYVVSREPPASPPLAGKLRSLATRLAERVWRKIRGR